ncbi:DUF1684 domain-containing protein [soil metagenome]
MAAPSGQMTLPEDHLSLLEWKRRIFDLYERVRAEQDPRQAWDLWRRTRDDLFARHPQSPIPSVQRDAWKGLDLFDYDVEARVLATVLPSEPRHYDIASSGGGGTFGFTRFATAAFELAGERQSLELYWLDGYGGGLFLSYRDATSGSETYGAGRYLLDTVKGADLGMDGDRLVRDFNFSYNPSCAYDPRWVCPLVTPPNHLGLEVRAGEKTPQT